MLHRGGIARSSQYVLVVFAVAAFLVGWLLVWASPLAQPVVASDAPGETNSAARLCVPATPTCPPSWGIVTSPNPSSTLNYLFGVDAVSANDIWAVGSYNSTNWTTRTLIMHWDGSHWSIISSPSPGTSSDQLFDVDAISSNDVWAVGYTYSSGVSRLPIMEHWDGVQWSVVSNPTTPAIDNYLYSVSAVSSNDIWAVGHYYTQGSRHTLAEHWDGVQWSIVPTPNGDFALKGVSAVSANDVWAVGAGATFAIIEHWDGAQWSAVSNPDPPGTYVSNLQDITAVSSNDVWAVGRWGDGTVDHTLTKHWDGVQWSVVSSPDVTTRTNWLFDVSALSPTDVWAVGYYCCTGVGTAGTLAEHWDGVQWSVVFSPNPSISDNTLNAVEAITSNDVWAVGYYQNSIYQTLTEHYSITDACLTPSPTPTITRTPTSTPTTTNTRIPTFTRTPTHTATSPPTMTITPTMTVITTNTPTPTPTFETMLIGHVNWEARPAQPSQRQELPITLTLRYGTTELDYPDTTTDQYGFFTVTLGVLPGGTYSWRVDDTASGQHAPNYLANAGVVFVGGGPMVNVEMGLMRTGDANNDNIVSAADFNILRRSFGFGCGDPAYDNRADFTGDCSVSVLDFNPLRGNFGQSGAPPVGTD